VSTPVEDWPVLLTVSETAALLRVSRMTVYRMLRDGELTSVRVGRAFRVREDEVRRMVGQS